MSEATSKSTPMCRIRSASCARAASGHAAATADGYLFPVGRMEGYINLKGYQKFASENRPSRWIAWLELRPLPNAGSGRSRPVSQPRRGVQ